MKKHLLLATLLLSFQSLAMAAGRIAPFPKPTQPTSLKIQAVYSTLATAEGAINKPNISSRSSILVGSVKETVMDGPITISLSASVRDHYEGEWITDGTITLNQITSSSMKKNYSTDNNVWLAGRVVMSGKYSMLMNDPDFGRVTFDVNLKGINADVFFDSRKNIGVMSFNMPDVVDGLGYYGTVREKIRYQLFFTTTGGSSF